MRKTTIFLSLIISLVAADSFAEINVSELESLWGMPESVIKERYPVNPLDVYNEMAKYTCQPHVIDLLNDDTGTRTKYPNVDSLPCVGFSRPSGCAEKQWNGCSYEDEYTTFMVIANVINAHGARFCPVQIVARNSNKDNSWLKFQNNPYNDDFQCTWLCKEGWTGTGCNTPVTDDMTVSKDLIKLDPDQYNESVYIGCDNFNETIPVFWSTKRTCYGNDFPEEHVGLLAIVGWLNSGHGAWVRQVVARSLRDGWSDTVSWPVLYPVKGSEPVLVCKIGYKPNDTKTDCVSIVPEPEPDEDEEAIDTRAPVTETDLCEGWKDSFNDELHSYYKNDYMNCYIYRCKQPGYAFVDDRKNACALCATNMRSGVDTATGKCVTCSVGQRFDDSAPNNCKVLAKISKNELLYGQGKTNSNSDYKSDCWAKSNSWEYEECMKEKAVVTTTQFTYTEQPLYTASNTNSQPSSGTTEEVATPSTQLEQGDNNGSNSGDEGSGTGGDTGNEDTSSDNEDSGGGDGNANSGKSSKLGQVKQQPDFDKTKAAVRSRR